MPVLSSQFMLLAKSAFWDGVLNRRTCRGVAEALWRPRRGAEEWWKPDGPSAAAIGLVQSQTSRDSRSLFKEMRGTRRKMVARGFLTLRNQGVRINSPWLRMIRDGLSDAELEERVVDRTKDTSMDVVDAQYPDITFDPLYVAIRLGQLNTVRLYPIHFLAGK
ncbi:hypothetical protein G7046_g9108 [Stylonectria norvegica]|nr:hypothetical protein G7046_g9108 [Stylonectria norvegica]